jgi:hypothetical protein
MIRDKKLKLNRKAHKGNLLKNRNSLFKNSQLFSLHNCMNKYLLHLNYSTIINLFYKY